ncbi:subtilisin-like protease SBT5.3 isoform X2 [Magnolia sinica]|uniref:subtilisin-like protease SBT5.3 isoform X2 n=1 Tax=Magnolia sinica TaxID=86752 RepID=UPI002658D27B|nr:subtilisin-like protease SBT5.3 isoform X2 [Magnolia sinica]
MMATKLFLFPLLIFVSSFIQTPSFASNKKSYVVYFGAHSHGSKPSSIDYERVTNSHHEFLASFVGSKEKAKNAIFYSYTKYVNGFAAKLEAEEADEISKHPDVISVFRNKMAKPHTTRSWEFLGLEKNGKIPETSLWQKARFGEDIIIGNLDYGVWPESESFNDDGMGPIPKRWKGSCDSKGGVRCNRKLIGARYFKEGHEAEHGPIKATLSARDTDGHGTHTLSTAGGRSVPVANFFGYGNGTAKGGSPNARVAAYKVCWPGCSDADILSGFEAAISDGVDVLSVSLGGVGSAVEYFQSGIEIGSFHAVINGITIICSAGNSGPTSGTVDNVAPWIITVGASTMDREFLSYVQLGNKKLIKGQSLSQTALPPNKSYPLIISRDAKSAKSTVRNATFCLPGSLNPKKVTGKIVACQVGLIESAEKGDVVKRAGGVGAIIMNVPITDAHAQPHLLPATDIAWDGTLVLLSYIGSTPSPTAYITGPTTQHGTKPAPIMAAFSSRGPSRITPEILKPDITAPGVDVLAAYTQYTGPSDLPSDPRRVPFNIISGTSMACPHIAGIAGLLKAVHPKWSPSAIKSAIMTTARTKDNVGLPMRNSTFSKATPFSYGAGHVNPNRAVDPGLVYDLTVKDYLNFLCAIGYNKTFFEGFTGLPYSCNRKSLNLLDFNYPSITILHLSGLTTVSRTVKNVGHPSTYTARILAPPGISVSVKPMSLKFEKIGEEKTFKVSLQAKEGSGVADDYVFGKLIWSDGKHYVRSPIVVKVAKA